MSRTVEFGRYRKDDTDLAIPIEWLVLHEDENSVFVVAQHAIVKRCFDEEFQTWKVSEIRRWLNTEFYDQAFSSSEKQCIQPTQVGVTDWEGSVVEQSVDDIFLLSSEEFRMCVSNQTEEWWLRDRGVCDSTAILVRQDGSLDLYANAQIAYGIRPAMHILKNYAELVIPEIPILEGQMMLVDNKECHVEDVHVELETELDQILTDLEMDPNGDSCGFRWLREAILLAVRYPNTWQVRYLTLIGKREGITRERVRQILYKTVWDHWHVRSAFTLSNHFGYPIQAQFEYVKPNHVEFITLLSEELRRKYKIM